MNELIRTLWSGPRQFGLFGALTIVALAIIVWQGALLWQKHLQINALSSSISQGTSRPGLTARGTVNEPTQVSLARRQDELNPMMRSEQIDEAMAKLMRLAKLASIQVPNGNYSHQAEPAIDAQVFQIELVIRGTYPRVRAFVAMALNSMPSVYLQGISINRKSKQEQQVQADIRFGMFVQQEGLI